MSLCYTCTTKIQFGANDEHELESRSESVPPLLVCEPPLGRYTSTMTRVMLQSSVFFQKKSSVVVVVVVVVLLLLLLEGRGRGGA